MHVHREGPDDARTSVLLLHAGASSGAQWTGYARTLGPDVRTLAPDLHGHGGTPLPADITAANAIDRMVDDILDLIPGDARFHLVGHSFGGLLALALASRGPARILSLTVVEPACFDALRVAGPRALYELSCTEVEQLTTLVDRGEHEQAMRMVVARWGMGRWELFTPQQRAAFVALAPALLGVGLAAALRWRFDPGCSPASPTYLHYSSTASTAPTSPCTSARPCAPPSRGHGAYASRVLATCCRSRTGPRCASCSSGSSTRARDSSIASQRAAKRRISSRNHVSASSVNMKLSRMCAIVSFSTSV